MPLSVIIGGTRGLGLALAKAFSEAGQDVWVAGRTKPSGEVPGIRHIQCDLSDPVHATEAVATALVGKSIDYLIYNAGIWENVTPDKLTAIDVTNIISVNLTSLVSIISRLIPNISAGAGRRIFLIGSTCGLENEGSTTAAYTASKFGVRGAAHAFREFFRPMGISVTCVSPGSIATDIPYSGNPELALSTHNAQRIPVEDLVLLIEAICKMSVASCPKEIVLPAMGDTDV